MYSLVEMLTYCRPEGSLAQELFCKRYLRPAMGTPDMYGNYTKIIGDSPTVCFAAHHDTVHWFSGMQRVEVSGDIVVLPKNTPSSCLGADCTTGVWLILGMIEEGIEGVYVVHAGEEIGCVGSIKLVASAPKWFDHVQSIISLDRYGTESIITHQMSTRTASDAFAISLGSILDLPLLRPDDGGSYTDSNEYRAIIPECTNLSVGYYDQHTRNETQDLWFADVLLERMIDAKWDELIIERIPEEDTWEYDMYDQWGTGYGRYDNKKYKSQFDWDYKAEDKEEEEHDMLIRFLKKYPVEVAELLSDWGIATEYLIEELSIQDTEFINDYIARRLG